MDSQIVRSKLHCYYKDLLILWWFIPMFRNNAQYSINVLNNDLYYKDMMFSTDT